MTDLRAFIFNLVFYINLIFLLVIYLPLLIAPRKWIMEGLKFWGHSSIWWHRILVGTQVEFRHLERIPKGPLMVACKHQSLWETFALFALFDDPVVVMKKELMWIPFFGWYGAKMRMIPVDRSEGARSLRKVIAVAKEETAKGRQIIIFPEGTRTAPGAEPVYRGGIALIYHALGLPCLPVALNSGWFWPRRKAVRYPGTIIVDILEPMEAGLAKAKFLQNLERTIEDASNNIAIETANAQFGPPIPANYKGTELLGSEPRHED